jgi:hypothetical protein
MQGLNKAFSEFILDMQDRFPYGLPSQKQDHIKSKTAHQGGNLKNLNKLAKTIPAIAGGVIVLALALAVFTQFGGTELFGASKPPLTIDPLNPRVHPETCEYEYTSVFKAVNASGNCNWAISDQQLGWALENGMFKVRVTYFKIPITFVVTATCGKETATSTVTYTWMN